MPRTLHGQTRRSAGRAHGTQSLDYTSIMRSFRSDNCAGLCPEALAEAGYGFYLFGEAAKNMSRLMCSFDTTPDDVDGLLRVIETDRGGAG